MAHVDLLSEAKFLFSARLANSDAKYRATNYFAFEKRSTWAI
jgi:hypothetical protein